ncbi:MAG TPA: GspH/FimT family pseudopilin [Propylenella sp.]
MTPPTLSAASRGRRRDGGFALYELILALAILGMVAGVVYPHLARGPGPAEIGARAEAIAALLRTDRNVAIREGRPVVSRVDVGDGVVYSGASDRAVAIPRGVKFEFVQSSREALAGGGGIRFNPNGRSSGGALTLRRDDFAYQISVNWLTAGVLVGRPAASRSGG